MIILNNWPFHDELLRYLCIKYGDQINSFNYSTEKIYHFNEWRFRRKEKPVDLKIFMPNECELDIVYKNENIHIKFEVIKGNNNVPYKLLSSHDCQTEEEIVTKIEMTANTKELMTDFADEANEWCKTERKKIKMNTKETMNIYYYK